MRWDFGQLVEGIEEFQRRSQRTQKSLADGSVGGATLLGSPTPGLAGPPAVGVVADIPSGQFVPDFLHIYNGGWLTPGTGLAAVEWGSVQDSQGTTFTWDAMVSTTKVFVTRECLVNMVVDSTFDTSADSTEYCKIQLGRGSGVLLDEQPHAVVVPPASSYSSETFTGLGQAWQAICTAGSWISLFAARGISGQAFYSHMRLWAGD